MGAVVRSRRAARIAGLTAALLLGCGGVATAVPPPATYLSAGREQTYSVPAGVTLIRVVAVGAPGGAGAVGGNGVPAGAGGAGAQVTADVRVIPGRLLYVEVGGAGADGGGGGFNGGGGGGGNGTGPAGGGGGGASDVRTISFPLPGASQAASLGARLVVAAGGGGGGAGSAVNPGGNGGGAGASGRPGVGPSSGAGGEPGFIGAAGEGGGAGGAPGCGELGLHFGTPRGSAGELSSGGHGGANSGGFLPGPGPVAGGGGGGGGHWGGGGGAGGCVVDDGGGGGGGGASFATAAAANVSIGPVPAGAAASVVITPLQEAVSVAPASLAFPGTPVGQVSAASPVTVVNTGTASLRLGGLGLLGPHAGDFLLGADGCRTTLAPGASCSVDVRFVPGGTGARAAALGVAANDDAVSAQVGLSGTGGARRASGAECAAWAVRAERLQVRIRSIRSRSRAAVAQRRRLAVQRNGYARLLRAGCAPMR
jgi:hypothetical protein